MNRQFEFFVKLISFIMMLAIFPGCKLLAKLFKSNKCEKKIDRKNSGVLYKIVPIVDFDEKNIENCIKRSPLDLNSGFIHLAYKNQVAHILQKFFKNVQRVLVLEIDLKMLQNNGSVLRVEPNKPGGEKFPHLYGTQKIPRAAVKKVITQQKDASGIWKELQ